MNPYGIHCCYTRLGTQQYFVHRTMHHPLLYKHFHKQHHDFKVPVCVAAEYAGVVEAIFSNMRLLRSGCAPRMESPWLHPKQGDFSQRMSRGMMVGRASLTAVT